MGLMCSPSKRTCFSVAVNKPIKDMNCQTGQARQYFYYFVLKALSPVWCRTDPTGPEVELVAYKIEDLLGLQF